MKKHHGQATDNAFNAEKDEDICPECKAKMATNYPKGQEPSGSYNKTQSSGCKHCGKMFKSVR